MTHPTFPSALEVAIGEDRRKKQPRTNLAIAGTIQTNRPPQSSFQSIVPTLVNIQQTTQTRNNQALRRHADTRSLSFGDVHYTHVWGQSKGGVNLRRLTVVVAPGVHIEGVREGVQRGVVRGVQRGCRRRPRRQISWGRAGERFVATRGFRGGAVSGTSVDNRT